MTLKSKSSKALTVYLILAALFMCALVVSNLIFQKFVSIDFFGLYTFKISVGVLPYPITFLITDIISEIYGKKKANQIVTVGIFASIFSMLIVYTASALPAIDNSPVSNDQFTLVFGQTALAVLASMMAYLFAQYVDIMVFHFWKNVTKGKHLWLRNNFSTFTSQFVDTFSVLFLLCSFEILPWDVFSELLWSGFLFKVVIAILDTPFLYAAVYALQRKFGLQWGEELSLLNE